MFFFKLCIEAEKTNTYKIVMVFFSLFFFKHLTQTKEHDHLFGVVFSSTQ